MTTRTIFVTGTGTGVGKTFVAAALLADPTFAYWKPVQTGTAEPDGDDTADALRQSGRTDARSDAFATLDNLLDIQAPVQDRQGPASRPL